MNRRTIALLAFILLALVGILLWNPSGTVSDRDADAASAAAPSSAPTRWFSGSSRVPSKLLRHTIHNHNRHATHAPDELRNFIIPELTATDATAEEALAALFAQYNEICRNTGETPLRFNDRIKGTPSSTFDLQLKQVSFLRALRIIAARSGLVLDRDGTNLVFSTIPLEHSDSLVTAQRPVPPTFLTDLEHIFSPSSTSPDPEPFGQNRAPDDTRFARTSIDPPANPTVTFAGTPLIDQLRELGIVRSSNAAVSYLPGTSTLVLKASQADQTRLESFLDDEFLNNRPVQLRTTTKFIESTKPIAFEKTQFSDEEFQEVMRTLAQTKGIDMMTQPKVVSRPGQAATIEIGREIIIPDPDNAGKFNKDWTGVKTQITSGGYGFDLQSTISSEVRVAMGDATDSIKGVTADASQHHPAGHTVLIESTTPGGTPLYIFATTQRIDATGRPYDPRQPEESP